MREPVVESVDGQSAEDDLVSGLIDDCAGQLEKNNLWDANTNNSIKHFSDIYNIASQEGDDDDDDSLSFDRLLGHARLEKSPIESWIATMSSSDVESTAGINILASASLLRPFIPAAVVPPGLLGSVNCSGLLQDQTLLPITRPAEQVAMIPVIEQSAKLSFASMHGDLPSHHTPNVPTNQNQPVVVTSGQSSVPQTWTPVNSSDVSRMYLPKTQLKSSRSRTNRPKMEVSKPAMNEKESHELERVMDILKRYKQQLAEGDQIGHFLPCKRKRSKPPSQTTDLPSSYSKPAEIETTEHDRTVMLDTTNSKFSDKVNVNHVPTTSSFCYEARPPQPDLNDLVGVVRCGDGRILSMANPVMYSSIMTGSDSVSSYSPGNSYGATPPVSMLQCSPSTMDQASRCTSVGIEYQLESAQGVVAKYQNQLPPVGYTCSPAGENISEAGLVSLTMNNEQERTVPYVESNEISGAQNQRLAQQESMSTLFDVHEENLLTDALLVEDGTNATSTKLTSEQIWQNIPESAPNCKCLTALGEVFDESKEGPYYTQLGAAESVAKIRQLMERRLGITGAALRIEKIIFTGKEGKNTNGCPVAKWIIRRSSEEEKILCLVRKRPGHTCETAVLIVGIVIWEGIADSKQSDSLYDSLTQVLSLHGLSTERRCGSNDQKTCRCQGWDESTGGASFTFGCSWSMFYNGCKFAKSSMPRKFRLRKPQEEARLERCLQQLASDITPLYAKAAPGSFSNQTLAGNEANDCRLGYTKLRAWSGVTAAVDYCTHSHKDINNMHNGCVAVVTLTKHRSFHKKPEDEQLHVLPLYIMDSTDEFDSIDGQHDKILSGALECLTKFTSVMRIQPQKTNCQPRRNYRNKSKPGSKPAEGIPKKVGNVSHKRLRPSRSKANKLNTQKLPEVFGKALPTKVGEQKFRFMEDSGAKTNTHLVKAVLNNEQIVDSSVKTETAERSILNQIVKAHQARIDSDLDIDGTKKDRKGNVISSTSQSQHMFTEGVSITLQQKTSEGQFCPSIPNQLHPDLLKSVTEQPEDAGATLQQQIPSHGLQIFWNLESSKKSQTGVGSHNQWVKRSVRSSDFKNNDKLSQDNDLMTLNSAAGIIPIQTVSSFGNHTTRHTAAVSCGQQLMSDEKTASEIGCNAPPVDGIHLTTPSSLPSMSSSYPQKCGGFLQMLNGDEDIGYRDGFLNSNEYCATQYLHQQGSNNESSNCLEVKTEESKTAYTDISFSRMKNNANSSPDSRKEVQTNNEHLFKDSSIGGVAIALTHGSVFFEVAKREVHATTALKNPNRFAPTRIALILYQHKHLNHRNHGSRQPGKVTGQEKENNTTEKDTKSLDDDVQAQHRETYSLNESSAYGSSSAQGNYQEVVVENHFPVAGECLWTAPVNNVHTLTTTTMVTKWIQPKLATSGPYQCWG